MKPTMPQYSYRREFPFAPLASTLCPSLLLRTAPLSRRGAHRFINAPLEPVVAPLRPVMMLSLTCRAPSTGGRLQFHKHAPRTRLAPLFPVPYVTSFANVGTPLHRFIHAPLERGCAPPACNVLSLTVRSPLAWRTPYSLVNAPLESG